MHLKNILLLLALFSIPVVIGVGIWLIWFGPGIEEGPKFPRDSHGGFIQPVTMRIEGKNISADWVIPTVCGNNEVEFQHDGEDADSWSGAPASCIQEEAGFTCQADLSDRELSKGVTYHLQSHNYLCANGDYYNSTLTTFSL